SLESAASNSEDTSWSTGNNVDMAVLEPSGPLPQARVGVDLSIPPRSFAARGKPRGAIDRIKDSHVCNGVLTIDLGADSPGCVDERGELAGIRCFARNLFHPSSGWAVHL